MTGENLLGGPAPTLLPDDPGTGTAADDAEAAVRAHPASSAAWAALAEQALTRGDDVAGYAFARVGYHRGLDALRRNGWRGQGPVPWSHEPNRGFLRCLAHLATAAERIGETAEVERCRTLLRDCDPEAEAALLG